MAITEEGRHKMYSRFEDTFGHEVATTLMEHLPPVGWADVATKQDLAMLRLEMSAELQRELRLHSIALFTGMVALNGISTGLVLGLG